MRSVPPEPLPVEHVRQVSRLIEAGWSVADTIDTTGTDDDVHGRASMNGGSQGMVGYEYQVDVSVWIALELMLAARLTESIVLEPVTDEDLEADLSELELGPVASRATVDGYRLVVQAKLRSGDAWTVPKLTGLLDHGTRRRPAISRLQQPDVRYLLVTSAALNGGTRALRVPRPASWPPPPSVPDMIASGSPISLEGRLAIVFLEPAQLENELRRLLMETLCVSRTVLASCLTQLREKARLFMLAGDATWHRRDLESTLVRFGATLSGSPLLDVYVPPSNWPRLRERMRERHAALIVGQSGTGKTAATDRLYEELRQELPGLTRVLVKGEPSEVLRDQRPPPVLYDIEDPWGQHAYEPSRRSWKAQLQTIFERARHDRLVVATSRRDVATHATALEKLGPWEFPLEAEAYGPAQKAAMYDARVGRLPRRFQLDARRAKARVLDVLRTPLEIAKFFDSLATPADVVKEGTDPIREAIDRSHESAIEGTVRDQIEARDDLPAAVTLWCLLEALQPVPNSLLRALEGPLFERDEALATALSPLREFLVAARNLRMSEHGFSYAHPRVKAGVVTLLKANPLKAGRTVRVLIDVLCSDGRDEWAEATASILRAAYETGIPPTSIPRHVEDAIDGWLSARVRRNGTPFEADLKLAAAVGSERSVVAEIARFLLHRPSKQFEFLMSWERPSRSDDWYERMRRDAETRRILVRFIEEVLPTDRSDYSEGLIDAMDRLADDLMPAFIEAASTIVGTGYVGSDETIVEGALRDLSAFELVVDQAVSVLSRLREPDPAWERISLELTNEVHNTDYADHLSDRDDGYTADAFLRAYTRKARPTLGWQHLAMHRHVHFLLPYWIRFAFEGPDDEPDDAELEAIWKLCVDDDETDAFELVARLGSETLRRRLLARMQTLNASDDVRRSGLRALVRHDLPRAGEYIDEIVRSADESRLVRLALDLGELRSDRYPTKVEDGPLDNVLRRLPESYRYVSRAAYQLGEGEPPERLDEVVATLQSANHQGSAFRRFRVALSLFADLDAEADIRWLLDVTDEKDDAVLATRAAGRHGLVDVLHTALGHRFAHARAEALRSLAETSLDPLPPRLLQIAEDEASPVRKALAAILADRVHPDHLDTLVKLAGDEWGMESAYRQDVGSSFPIARKAATSIMAYETLPRTEWPALLEIVRTTTDRVVRSKLLDALVRTRHADAQSSVLELARTDARPSLRLAAAHALVGFGTEVDPTVAAAIGSSDLLEREPQVAAVLGLLLSLRAPNKELREAARDVSKSQDRIVFVALLLVGAKMSGRDEVADAIACHLPNGHRIVETSMGTGKEPLEDADVEDLGEPEACAAALSWINRLVRARED